MLRKFGWHQGLRIVFQVRADDGTTCGSKEEFKDRVSLSPSRRLPNLGDEIHLKGGRIVTPQNLPLLKIGLKWFISEFCAHKT